MLKQSIHRRQMKSTVTRAVFQWEWIGRWGAMSLALKSQQSAARVVYMRCTPLLCPPGPGAGFWWVFLPWTPLFSLKSATGSALKVSFARGSGGGWRRAPVTCWYSKFLVLLPLAREPRTAQPPNTLPSCSWPGLPWVHLPPSNVEHPTGHHGACCPSASRTAGTARGMYSLWKTDNIFTVGSVLLHRNGWWSKNGPRNLFTAASG